METLVINIPEQKTALVKELLKELGVTFKIKSKKSEIPNALTVKTIEDARKGVGVGEPITDVKSFLDSL